MAKDESALQELGQAVYQEGAKRVESKTIGWGGKTDLTGEIKLLDEEQRGQVQKLFDLYTTYQLKQSESDPKRISSKAEIAKMVLAGSGLATAEQQAVAYAMLEGMLREMQTGSEFAEQFGMYDAQGGLTENGKDVIDTATSYQQLIFGNFTGRDLKAGYSGKISVGEIFTYRGKLSTLRGEKAQAHVAGEFEKHRGEFKIEQEIREAEASIKSGAIFEDRRSALVEQCQRLSAQATESGLRDVLNQIRAAALTAPNVEQIENALNDAKELLSHPTLTEVLTTYRESKPNPIDLVIEQRMTKDLDAKMRQIAMRKTEPLGSPEQTQTTVNEIKEALSQETDPANQRVLQTKLGYARQAETLVGGQTVDQFLELEKPGLAELTSTLGYIGNDNLRSALVRQFGIRETDSRKQERAIDRQLKGIGLLDLLGMLIGIVDVESHKPVQVKRTKQEQARQQQAGPQRQGGQGQRKRKRPQGNRNQGGSPSGSQTKPGGNQSQGQPGQPTT